MSRLSIRAILGGVVVLIVATAGVVLNGSAAHAAGVRGSAFIWSYDAFLPIGEGYTPSFGYQYNSSSPDSPNNVVHHVAEGEYWVYTPGLTGFGISHVTAYGGDAAYCNGGASALGDSSPGIVMCFDAFGRPVDHMFTLSFTSMTPSISEHPLAYMYVEENGSIFPSLHFNSGGGQSWVTRDGLAYEVHIPNLGGFSGHVQVTAANRGDRCVVRSWWPDGSDQVVIIRCLLRSNNDFPTDAPFALTFTADQNILGYPGLESAYAWADLPSLDEPYLPSPWYLFSTGQSGTATAARTGTGEYSMTFDGVNLNGGNVQVSAYGWGGAFCNVLYWSGSTVNIRCYNVDGNLADSLYTVAFTGTSLPGG